MSVLVGKKAPVFSSSAVINGGEVIENFSLKQYMNLRMKVRTWVSFADESVQGIRILHAVLVPR